MIRQQRFRLVSVVLGAIGAAAFGYAVNGVGLAVVGLIVFLIPTGLALKFAPLQKPPPPSLVSRPVVGATPDAIRRRRMQRVGVLAANIPLICILAVLGLAVPIPAIQAGAFAFAVLVLGSTIFGLLLTSRSEFWESYQLRRYDRVVARLEKDRDDYERRQARRGDRDGYS